jgi:hypothetical protein
MRAAGSGRPGSAAVAELEFADRLTVDIASVLLVVLVLPAFLEV